ncbi:MAG: DUF1016 family protein [Alphaproteobacteria bacterium]|nr:DUF1016 family protein [Alphaproteobacteria bacterium]
MITNNQNEISNPDSARIDILYSKVQSHIDSARLNVQKSINLEMVHAFWLIGRDIVEEDQQGKETTKYGQAVLQTLSTKLTQQYGRGFSVDNLERARKFYLTYPGGSLEDISATLSRKSSTAPQFHQNLSWSHYIQLIRVNRPDARSFYALEASENNWSARELQRQIGSLLFDRLAKSKDKDGLLELACRGQEISRPQDAIKDPVVLEFLGIPESHKLVESKMEEALISNLQKFLLELGKGFAFVDRQKRLTLDSDHFYADLVFYHIILKCYVVIDIKTKKLTHGDLGQIMLYVNYFDQEIKTDNDNPTIGLVLCTDKSDAMVKYTLGDKAKQIFASSYQFHLPTEAELEAELKREIKEIKHQLQEDED